MMISFKPVGLLHAPKVATYQYVLMLHDLLTYLLSYGMFRKLPLSSPQVHPILSSQLHVLRMI